MKEQEPKDTTLDDLGMKVEMDNLSQDHMRNPRDILGSWSQIFSTHPIDLGRTDFIEHVIKLTDNTPFKEP